MPEFLDEGTTGEILGKEICRFIMTHPSKSKMRIGELKEMLALVVSVCLHNEMSAFPRDIQVMSGMDFTQTFAEYYGKIIAGEEEKKRKFRK